MRAMTLMLAVLLASPAFAQEERASSGDRLLIDKVRSDAAQGPSRGMRMEQVEARYGEPISRSASVGEPPITRWEYAEFTVYFETNSVIHTVPRRDPPQERTS